MRQSGSNVQMMHIRRLMDAINAGEIAIPDFQRDFDWSESDVKELLVTVFSGWPAGSLLLLDARKEIFHLRSLEGGPDVALEPSYAILDGQQRLTSLYHAFFEKGDVLYAVDWTLDERNELDDRIVSFSRNTWEKKRLSTIESQAKEHILPISVLKTASDFFEWRDEVVEYSPLVLRADIKKRLTEFYTRNLSAVHEYEFPAVILESSLEPEAIARIFERVNRTGLKLSAFDLMVAKTFRPDWNLRDRWIELREQYPKVSAFLGDDGMPLLQAIALRENADIRKSSVLALERSAVHNSWAKAGQSANNAIEFLQSRCAAVKEEFVPYQASIALLTALDMDGLMQPSESEIGNWFWQSTFDRSFDVASNTRLVSHYRALKSGEQERLFRDIAHVDLYAANKRNAKALWAGVSCILAAGILKSGAMAIDDFMVDELEVAFVYARQEVPSVMDFGIDENQFIDYYRSLLNAVLVPRAHVAAINRMSAKETLDYCKWNDLTNLLRAQIDDIDNMIATGYHEYYSNRNIQIGEFLRKSTGNMANIEFATHELEEPI